MYVYMKEAKFNDFSTVKIILLKITLQAVGYRAMIKGNTLHMYKKAVH